MKSTTAFLFCALLLSGCAKMIERQNQEKEAEKRRKEHVEKFFAGTHELRKMVNLQGIQGHMGGGFFLFAGGMSGNLSSSLNVTFSWKANNGDFITTTLDAEAVKVRFNEKRKSPVITHIDYYSNWYDEDLNDPVVVNRMINYVIVECKETDWKTDISMPLEDIK